MLLDDLVVPTKRMPLDLDSMRGLILFSPNPFLCQGVLSTLTPTGSKAPLAKHTRSHFSCAFLVGLVTKAHAFPEELLPRGPLDTVGVNEEKTILALVPIVGNKLNRVTRS